MSEEKARFRITLRGVSVAYFALLILGWGLQYWWAERFLVLWVLMYAPALLLLVPMGPLALYATWKKQWRWLGAYLICTLVVLLGYARYRVHFGGGGKPAFTVVTHNIGQGNKVGFSEGFPGLNADAILLQDANYREKDYARRYPDMKVRGVAQFILLTPHEIMEAAAIPGALWRGKPVAARYVIRVGARDIALYNVHIPTPRQPLRAALSPRGLLEMVGLRSAPTEDYPSYRAWLDARVALSRQLADIIARETLPFVAAGDFNAPERGMSYRAFATRFTDAHVAAGTGWGFTFPGARDGRMARLIGSWLRLDYVFVGPGWKVTDCRVASDERSQHRAVSASLDFAP